MFYQELETWLREDTNRTASITWLNGADKWKVTLCNLAKGAPRNMAETSSSRIAWAIADALEAMQPRKVTVVTAKQVSGVRV
jgi:hypothetical protein